MHNYNSDSEQENQRKKIYTVLIILSVVITPFANCLINFLMIKATHISFFETINNTLLNTGLTPTVSVIVIFMFLKYLVDKFYYLRIFHPFTNMPYIGGQWEGTLHSKFDSGKDIDMKLDITQTLSKIKCVATFEKSSSSSTIAYVEPVNETEVRFNFVYKNDSENYNLAQKNHFGFNYFTVRGNNMEGAYITDRCGNDNTYNSGTISLHKNEGKK